MKKKKSQLKKVEYNAETIYGSNAAKIKEDGYKPGVMNWKKAAIIFAVFSSIVTGAVLIWWFALRGKDYIDYRSQAKEAYIAMLVDTDEKKVENLNFISQDLKNSTLSMVQDVKDIYSHGGFTDATQNFTNYKYSIDRSYPVTDMLGPVQDRVGIESQSKHKEDWVFGFVDNHITKTYQPTSTKPYFHKYFSDRFILRIQNGKIAAVGFDASNAAERYTWLTGSRTEGL